MSLATHAVFTTRAGRKKVICTTAWSTQSSPLSSSDTTYRFTQSGNAAHMSHIWLGAGVYPHIAKRYKDMFCKEQMQNTVSCTVVPIPECRGAIEFAQKSMSILKSMSGIGLVTWR